MSTMKISVTATRQGITEWQRGQADKLFTRYFISALVHGGAIGGDDELDTLAVSFHVPRVIFPSTHPTALPRTHFERRGGEIIWHPAKPPLDRNTDIVNAGDLLLVFPKSLREELRSGTWAAYRYAKRNARRLEVIWPTPRIGER